MHRQLHGYFVTISNVVVNDDNKTNPTHVATLANLPHSALTTTRNSGILALCVLGIGISVEKQIM